MVDNNYCFVIQPFCEVKYNKRFVEVYKPAIEKSGLNAYRVDLDANVRIIIDEIEQKIADSRLCLADISLDNPNVWYELGYAYALGKDVVMVSDENRKSFPFDISHKSIIPYKTESPSDFEELSESITKKIKSYISSYKTSEKLIKNPLSSSDGLQAYEKALLALIIGEQLTDEQTVSVYGLRNQMMKAGFNETATSIGLRLLQRKGFIITLIDSDFGGNDFNACKLTENGIEFILKNIELFDLNQHTEKFDPNSFPF